MDKRQLHHLYVKTRWLKAWYFLVLAVISAVICVFALRENNQQMIQLRQAVYVADKDNGDVQTVLKQLQAYVTSHMNTSLNTANNVYPPIQLKYTYERLLQAQTDQANLDNNQLYSAAQASCEQRYPAGVGGSGRIPCIQQYVSDYNLKRAQVPDALYKFSFVSPRWSPDLAGWSMVAAIASATLFIVTLIGKSILKRAAR